MDENTRRQAHHFDEKTPITPWPEVLRSEGFRFHYIAKDLLVKQALDKAGLRAGSRVLDVGCGVGVWLDRIGRTYGTVGFGIDVSRQSLVSANSEKRGRNSFIVADARALPFAGSSFDLVTSLDVLEHIERPLEVIDEMIRSLAEGGMLVAYAVSARNRFTLEWLQKKLLTLVGVDMNAISSHDPALLIDPATIQYHVEGRGISSWRIEYFHAFFSSLFDQFFLISYLILKKAGVFSLGQTAQRILGLPWLALSSFLSRASFGVLTRLDGPWYRKGLSNGFLALASKQSRLGR
ncbi:MAG: class I SAM-dependent methyltransferase [Terriglobia bacterium]